MNQHKQMETIKTHETQNKNIRNRHHNHKTVNAPSVCSHMAHPTPSVCDLLALPTRLRECYINTSAQKQTKRINARVQENKQEHAEEQTRANQRQPTTASRKEENRTRTNGIIGSLPLGIITKLWKTKRNVVICMLPLGSPWLTSTCSTITCFWTTNKQLWHNMHPQRRTKAWHIYVLVRDYETLEIHHPICRTWYFLLFVQVFNPFKMKSQLACNSLSRQGPHPSWSLRMRAQSETARTC